MNGIFLDGSVTGLTYVTIPNGIYTSDTWNTSQIPEEKFLDSQGHFNCGENDTILFSVGSLMLGSCRAKPVITPLDWVCEAQGRHVAVSHYQVQNIARLLLTMGNIDETCITAVNKVYTRLHFVQEPEDFEQDPAVQSILSDIGKPLYPAAGARNLVRRCANNIRKEARVKIPTRDGHYVMATVYRPLTEGKYPVVMSMGAWGRDFINGFSMNESERERFLEEIEDRFYDDYGNLDSKRLLQKTFMDRLGPCFASLKLPPNLAQEDLEELERQKNASAPPAAPAHLVPVSEAFEQPCAMDWIPYGYCVINVDERGVGDNREGYDLKQFGEQNAEDYYDAIEWAASQEWSSGNIGLFGASYYAMTQYNVAWRRPKGLKAMIPVMGDWDSYRDYMHSGGGLLNIADNMALSAPDQQYTLMNRALENPFWNETAYGKHAEYMATCDMSQIDIPIFPCTEPDASLHGKGSSEAYIMSPSKNKKFILINSCGIHFWIFHPEHIARFRRFFDKWLKGMENGIMEEPRVDLQIRCGNGTYYWKQAEDWPVPGTQYRKFYLDGNSLTQTPPAEQKSVTYNADVKHHLKKRVPGTTFLSEPFTEDLALAGYIKAGLYVSSTTCDMEIHMNVRVLDENDNEVIYPPQTTMEPELPLGFGSMLVSHRSLDETRSRDYLPVYKHTEEAYQPLIPGETVYCEIGTFPTSGLIRKGWKLRLDIDPASWRWVNYKEEKYREGSYNTIYTGGATLSFLQLPVLP